jgi:hypothetical protein
MNLSEHEFERELLPLPASGSSCRENPVSVWLATAANCV